MRRSLQVLCLVMTAVSLPAVASVAQSSDIRATFLASNPNECWEYGFINEEGEFVAYNTTFDDGKGIAGWCLDNSPGPMGAVIANYSDHPIDRYGVCWQPGQISVRTAMSGHPVVIRWRASTDESVQISGTLTPQLPGVSPTIVVAVDGNKVMGAQAKASPDEAYSTSVEPVPSQLSQSALDSDDLIVSIAAALNTGSVVDFVVSQGDQQVSCHAAITLSIDAIELSGSLVDMASLGESVPTTQLDSQRLGTCSFPSVIDSGLFRGSESLWYIWGGSN